MAVSVDDIDKIATALKISPLFITVRCLKYLYPVLADPTDEVGRLLDRVITAAAKDEKGCTKKSKRLSH